MEHIDKCQTIITKVLRPILFRQDFIDASAGGMLFQHVEKLKVEITNEKEVKSIDNRLAKKQKTFV